MLKISLIMQESLADQHCLCFVK